MAIDPKKLEAFAGGKGGRGGPPPGDEGEKPPHDEPDNEEGEQTQGIEKFVPLMQLLEEFQDDVEQCIDELDGEALLDADAEMSPEDMQIMREGWDALDKRLKKEAAKVLPQLSQEDAAQIADHLYAEDKVADPDKFEGWIMRVAALLGGGEGGGGGGGEETPEEAPEEGAEG